MGKLPCDPFMLLVLARNLIPFHWSGRVLASWVYHWPDGRSVYESDRPHVMLGQNVTRLDVLFFDLMLNQFDFAVWVTLIEIQVENTRLLIRPCTRCSSRWVRISIQMVPLPMKYSGHGLHTAVLFSFTEQASLKHWISSHFSQQWCPSPLKPNGQG